MGDILSYRFHHPGKLMAKDSGIGHSGFELSKVDVEICATETPPMDTDKDLIFFWCGFWYFPEPDFLIVDENSCLHLIGVPLCIPA
jgi:hypothetical protein